MTKWKIMRSRSYTPGGGVDCSRGWAFDLERNGEARTVRVEVASTLDATSGPRPDDVKRALSTKGRSAVTPYLDQDEVPERIVISTVGVRAA